MPHRKTSTVPVYLQTDVILPIQDPYMDQIIDGSKDYEFRKYGLKPSVRRIWFYRTAPHSSITHVCEILPARTRNEGDPPLEEGGLGNKEFNSKQKDWDGYDFAYRITSVYELRDPIALSEMRAKYAFKSAPRGLVYLPKLLNKQVRWYQQKLILSRDNAMDNTTAPSKPCSKKQNETVNERVTKTAQSSSETID